MKKIDFVLKFPFFVFSSVFFFSSCTKYYNDFFIYIYIGFFFFYTARKQLLQSGLAINFVFNMIWEIKMAAAVVV